MRNVRPLLAGAALAALLALPASAEPIRWSWSSTVAAGAAIDSTVQILSDSGSVTCIADNSAGGAGRNFVATWYADDGTTALFASTTSVAAAGTTVFVIDPAASSATGFTPLPASPGRRMRFQLAAGGAAQGRLSCWGR